MINEEEATQGAVVGENLRRLRKSAGLTQSEMALKLRAVGLSWSRSHVAALEVGNREAFDLGTLMLIAEALTVPLFELFAGDGNVRLSADVSRPRLAIRQAAAGWKLGRLPTSIRFVALEVEYQADADLATRLGIPAGDVVHAARALWGRTLHEERDRRIAAMGELTATQRQAHRGHVTRELSRQVSASLEKSGPDA